ncbi:MAG: hypothetical protein ACKO96_13575, partial [Flammeovirgaceae bacterium]
MSEKQRSFNYNSILKEGSHEDEPDSIKLKIDVDGGKVKPNIAHIHEDKSVEFIECHNMDEVKDAIPFKCELRVIFQLKRIWIQPSLKIYGCIINLLAVQVKKPLN